MKKVAKTISFVALLMISIQLCAKDKKTKAPSPISAVAESGKPKVDRAYTIGPEDVLSINVWREPDVSGTLPVRPDGKISMPLLHDVQAAGLTPMQLADSIKEKLSAFISNPQVNVAISAIHSQTVYIIGEVGHAGSFPLSANTTVLQALSNAGNFSQYANVSKIYVLRKENGTPVKYPFDYKQVLKGKHMEQNIILNTGDTIVVP